MDLRPHLARQLLAALAMLRQAVERCPDTVWTRDRGHRPLWRIAYHALFFTDLYAQPTTADFQSWEHHQDDAMDLWPTPDPKPVRPYTRTEMLAYCRDLEARLPNLISALDPELPDSGFDWYALPKAEHMLLNLRHLSVHLGQIQEICYGEGIDLDWIGTSDLPASA